MQPDTVVAAAGTCFAISDRAGDMDSHAAHGFYAFDTRLLSLYRVRVQSRGLCPWAARHSAACFYTVNTGPRDPAANTISIVRDRYVADGMPYLTDS